mgnify:CR=1 FL=1
MKIYISGKLVAQRDAKISVFDHGLLYGDGVFEGIRAYNGRVFMLDRHIDRLFESAKAIELKILREGKQVMPVAVVPKAGKVDTTTPASTESLVGLTPMQLATKAYTK